MKKTAALCTCLLVLTGKIVLAQVTYTFDRIVAKEANAPIKANTTQMETTPNLPSYHEIMQQQRELYGNQLGLPEIPAPDALPQPRSFGSTRQNQMDDLRSILNEDRDREQRLWIVERNRQMQYFRQAFARLIAMKNGTSIFSIKDAVFLIENAYLNKSLSYDEYCGQIKEKVELISYRMEKEGIDTDSDLGKNYLIQQLYSQQVQGKEKLHKPYAYDFEDFWGEQDWSKMFVTKLLKTGSGQCHSLPLLYLILAEELGTEAWLSLAPQHSYIIFQSDHGLLNFETTNGYITDDEWVMRSGFITANAIKSKTYMDTLGHDGIFSCLLADLIMGYTDKFGYDLFMASMTDTLLSIHPKSVQGNAFKADLYWIRFLNEAQKTGNPSLEDIDRYPAMKGAYLQVQKQYTLMDQLGYADIPKEAYSEWLNSMDEMMEKQKSSNTSPR